MDKKLSRVEEYLGRLPAGLGSYPNHRQQASVYHAFTEGIDLASHVACLPPRLAKLVTRPPDPRDWLSEVEVTALYLAMIDLVFGEDERFVEYAYARNRVLLDGPLYRVMFRLAGSKRVVRQLASRWSIYHSGISMASTLTPDELGAVLRCDYPEHLVPPLIARCHATGCHAALELAGADDVRMDLISVTPTSFEVHGAWR